MTEEYEKCPTCGNWVEEIDYCSLCGKPKCAECEYDDAHCSRECYYFAETEFGGDE